MTSPHASNQPSAARNEELRSDVLAFLAVRQATSHKADTIRRRLNQDGQASYEPYELDSALTFLESLGYARFTRSPMGASIYWQATAEGTLAHERSGR